MKNYARKAAVALFAGAALTTAAVAPASAAPVVTGGLVNVTAVDLISFEQTQVAVNVPIAVAAGICDVSVAVLATDLRDGSGNCPAETGDQTIGTVQFAPRR